MDEVELRANGLRFGALTAGSGDRRALLLHGFPDTPHSFGPVARHLVERGFRVVAPWMRGYGPTEAPADRDYQIAALACDVVGLLDALEWDRAAVVGHDWGALATFAAAVLAPDRLRTAVGLSVPPGRLLAANAACCPRQWLRSWYVLAIQLPAFPEWWLGREDYTLLKSLWDGAGEGEDVERAAAAAYRAFRRSGTLDAALGYYRALVPGRSGSLVEWVRSWRLATGRVEVPSLLVAAGRDPAIDREMFAEPGRVFTDRWRLQRLDEAGHFAQLEAPERLADWTASFDEPDD